ncbi:MAG: UDP-N-acetylmuramate--L-alanine ligase [Pseudobdellovibrionaceae bacterium]
MHLTKARFHFIGVGGIGMCGLAELLQNMGAQVSGSDLSENANTERLKNLGVKVFKGHHANQVGSADVVVYSSAVSPDNPEMREARAKRIPLIQRAEALAEIMGLKRGVAIAGTHGKTTTTSMTASIFLEAEVSPTIVVGGRLDLIKSTAFLGEGEWLVAEADESDGSFQKLSPEISVITNIDSDHLDYYKTFENLQRAFYDFALKIPFYGAIIVCGDDPVIRDIFENFPKRIFTYGFDSKNDLVIRGQNGKYELHMHGLRVGEFEVRVPGKHNALNAAAAIATGMKAGFSFETCRKGLIKFEGVDRRFHFKGEEKSIPIYDDYGHHPTEVRATLQALREKFPEKRLVVAFQPHRYSRTEHCWSEFLTCFTQADELLLLDIYPAGESPIPGVTSEKLANEIKHAKCTYIPKTETLSSNIQNRLKAGDVFLTLGAGDGWKIGMDILKNLKGS